MKFRITLILVTLLSSCFDGQVESVFDDISVEIPAKEFERNEVLFNRKNSLWLLQSDSSLLSGYVTKKFSNGKQSERFGVFAGKREGLLSSYYPSGQLKFTETYKNNKLEGEVKRWSKENQLYAHLTYKHGKLHGVQKKWFATGELHKLMHMNMGKEEGLQQAFRKNGVLYVNYEARNGRTFGLKRSNLCYELDKEQVVFKD